MNIVKPSPKDIPELLGLWKSQYEYHHNLDDAYYVPFTKDLEQKFEAYLQKAISEDDPHILIAKNDQGHIDGFITFEEDKESYFDTQIKKFGVVIELFVTDKSRQSGTGKMLMTAAEDYFRSKGLADVKLACSTFNTNALGFYDHLGYVNRQSYLFKRI